MLRPERSRKTGGNMREDPIVAELYKHRAEILAEFGGDFDAYLDYLASLEAENRKRGLRYADPRAKKDAAQPDSA